MDIEMRYYKRVHSEIIQRFNKDWTAWEWYYFEVDTDNYAVKQLQKNHLGFVLKYDLNYMDDDLGGLAEGKLELTEEQYILIEKGEFYDLWNIDFTNEYLIKNLIFDNNWIMSWYNLNLNTSETELKSKELIICGSYNNTFLFELGYLLKSQFYFLQIKKANETVIYTTCTEWQEMANVAQIWIDKLQKV
jgi:hypothetical protein